MEKWAGPDGIFPYWSTVDLDKVTWPLGYHQCPFSYGPIGAFKCHLLLRYKRGTAKTFEVHCPEKRFQRGLDPSGPPTHKLPAIDACPLRRGPVTIHARYFLQCDLCGKLESSPFEAGDKCACGGRFQEFDPLAKIMNDEERREP